MMSRTQVALREITEETLRPILNLDVTEAQHAFVASNAVSIAQAYFSDKAWFRGIYVDDEPIGFVMLYLDKEKPEYFLWRFMIDQSQQGHGYGFQAMEQVIDFVRQQPNAKELGLSYSPGEGDPSGFYAKLGFVETGEMMEDQRIMQLKL